jgi:hypothetical protein
MKIYDLLNGLQPLDKEYYSNIGFSNEYIDVVNEKNSEYRDAILTKLNLHPTVNLHGGSIKVSFGTSGTNNILPMDKILSIIEAYGEDYVLNQIGGDVLDRVKNWWRGRSFEAFRARYDKLRDVLDTKIVQFEVEAKGIKSNTTEYAEKMRNLMLNNKFKTMMEIMLENDPNMEKQRKEYIENEVALAKVKSAQLLAVVTEFQKIVAEQRDEKKSILYYVTFGYGGEKKNFFDRLGGDLKKSFKEFNEIYKHFTELTEQTIKAKALKAKYGSLTPEVKSKLAPSQLKEYENWERNKEKYEKIEAFTEKHLDEAHKLIQKQSELNLLINDYNNAFGNIEGKDRNNAEKALKAWDEKMRDTYYKLGNCITHGNNYRKILEDAKQLIIDNSNDISALSISAVKPVLEEYKKHIQSVDHTSEIMNKLVLTLADIKNNFIKVVPSQNLQSDILYVSAARTYLLSLVENIKRRQIMFSGGEKHIRGVIKAQVGGVYLPGTITGCPLHFLHNHSNQIIMSDGSTVNYVEKDISKTINVQTTPGTPVVQFGVQAPFGLIRYDSTKTPTDINNRFEKWINTIAPKTEMILPILDLEQPGAPVIKIYKIEYVDISDINALDIKVEFIKDVPITGSNMKKFIPHTMNGDEYMIYNLYTEDADKYTSKGVKYHFYDNLFLNQASRKVILPVFGNLNTTAEMINADEYYLLNPLTGLPIMSFATTDTTRKLITLNLKSYNSANNMHTDATASANTDFYHFNAIGIKYAINPAQFTVDGSPFTNPNANISGLANAVDYHWNIIYQLTHILSLVIRECLHPKTDVKSTGITFRNPNINSINDKITPYGINSIPPAEHTKLQLASRNVNDTITDFFGGDPRISVIFIRKIINRELKSDDGDLAFYPRAPGTKAAAADSSLLSVDAPNQDSLTPKQRQAIDYIMRLIPKTSKYWANQSKILDKINEFFKPDYKDKFELELHTVQHLIYDLRKIEQDVLKIKINIKQPYDLPKYSIITETLEVKPNELKLGETGDTITDSGKALRGLVEQRSSFLKEFAAELNVDISNIVPLLREPIMLIYGGSDIKLSDWFYDPAHPDRVNILEVLRNESGADAFINQIKSSEFAGHKEKIFSRFLDGPLINSSHKGAYSIFMANKGRGKVDGHHDGRKKGDKRNKRQDKAIQINYGHQTHHGKKKDKRDRN